MDPDLTELKKLHDFHKTDRFSKMGIAIALGVNRRTVRRWFQGKYPPTKKHQRLIRYTNKLKSYYPLLKQVKV